MSSVISRVCFVVISVLATSASLAGLISTRVEGTFNHAQENACLSVSLSYFRADCSYTNAHKSVDGKPVPWVGPTEFAVYYPIGSKMASPDFRPKVGDGRISPRIVGTIAIDDRGTPESEDDLISGNLILKEAARSFIGRPNPRSRLSRGVEIWKRITHSFGPVRVNSVINNANGGQDYVIASKGFPDRICSGNSKFDCYPSKNAPKISLGKWGKAFWDSPGNLPLARGAAIGGNIGVSTAVEVEGYKCADKLGGAICESKEYGLSWGSDGAPLTNLLLRVATDSRGIVAEVQAYWTIERRLGGSRIDEIRTNQGESDSWWGGYMELLYAGE